MKNYIAKEERGLFDEEARLAEISKQGDPLWRSKEAIAWERLRPCLEEALFEAPAQGPGGRPPYDPLLLFQILVLQRYYNLSDEQAEYQIKDRLSFQRFLGLRLADRIPDARTIWLFREKLTQRKLVERLFAEFSSLLREEGLIGKEGKIVDATFIEAPRQRNRREENAQIKEGKVPPAWSEQESKLRHKDLEARSREKGQRDSLRLQRPHQNREGKQVHRTLRSQPRPYARFAGGNKIGGTGRWRSVWR